MLHIQTGEVKVVANITIEKEKKMHTKIEHVRREIILNESMTYHDIID